MIHLDISDMNDPHYLAKSEDVNEDQPKQERIDLVNFLLVIFG